MRPKRHISMSAGTRYNNTINNTFICTYHTYISLITTYDRIIIADDTMLIVIMLTFALKQQDHRIGYANITHCTSNYITTTDFTYRLRYVQLMYLYR